MKRHFYNHYSHYSNNPFNRNASMINPSINRNIRGDRFLGGGFLAPFLLGGLAGAALTRPRPIWCGPAYPWCCCYW